MGSRTSASTVSNRPWSPSAASCRCVSSWSSITSRSGSSAATCLAMTEPIDPPAPVTRTLRPRIRSRTGAGSSWTWARPRRSSIPRSRTSRSDRCPFTQAVVGGSTRTGTSASPTRSATRRATSGRSGIASSTWCTSRSRMTRGRSPITPTTGTPSSARRRSRGSSSTSATGTRPACGLCCISRTAAAPLVPAPDDGDPQPGVAHALPECAGRRTGGSGSARVPGAPSPPPAPRRSTTSGTLGSPRPKIGTSTTAVVTADSAMRRASSMLACCQVRPYPPQSPVDTTVTTTATGRKTSKRSQ